MLIHWGFATPHIDQSTEQQPLRNDRVGFSLSTCDKSSNGTNQTLLLKPLVCKPGTSIAQTMWQAHINTLIPSRWMNILAVDGRGGNSKVLSNCHTCPIPAFLICVWALCDACLTSGDHKETGSIYQTADATAAVSRARGRGAYVTWECVCVFVCFLVCVWVCVCVSVWERERDGGESWNLCFIFVYQKTIEYFCRFVQKSNFICLCML